MHDNPAQDWQWLTENYRSMLDGELEELAACLGDLTETAQQVLRSELSNRGLAQPGAKPVASERPESPAAGRWASSVDPDAGVSQAKEVDQDEDSPPREYTWKTQLCACETTEQANQIREMLRRADIDSWVEKPGTRWSVFSPRVVVAADQLEQAIEIARQPIPRDIVEQSTVEVPEYVAPKCPSCGAEDPVLESAEPTNSWLCEACGKQWVEPAVDADGEAGKAAK
jgi:ribosomal protein L37AE/L43A